MPPQYASMLNALKDKDKEREGTGGGTGPEKEGEGKEGEPIKDDVDKKPGEKALPTTPPAIHQGEENGKKAGEPGAGLKQASGGGLPPVPAPINPESLAEKSADEGQPEEDKPAGSGEWPEEGGEATGADDGNEGNGSGGPEEGSLPQQQNKKKPWEVASQMNRILGDNRLAGKAAGKATSKIWYYGFGSASATGFSGLDFFVGAIVMDLYWILGHRKDKDIFPLKFW